MSKKIITVILCLFVTASVAKLILSDKDKKDVTTGDAVESSSIIKGTQTIVYYFHGAVRCKTCNKIEANTRKAIESAFPEQLANGSLDVKDLNMEEAQNAELVDKYQLANSSVVISHIVDGNEVNWERLDKVWDLVHDEAEFASYIQQETETLMQETE